MKLPEWEDREFERIRRRLNKMRREMWFALLEDDEEDDPEGTPEPIMEAKQIRVGVFLIVHYVSY